MDKNVSANSKSKTPEKYKIPDLFQVQTKKVIKFNANYFKPIYHSLLQTDGRKDLMYTDFETFK